MNVADDQMSEQEKAILRRAEARTFNVSQPPAQEEATVTIPVSHGCNQGKQEAARLRKLRDIYGDLLILETRVKDLEQAGEPMGTIPQAIESMRDAIGAAIEQALGTQN